MASQAIQGHRAHQRQSKDYDSHLLIPRPGFSVPFLDKTEFLHKDVLIGKVEDENKNVHIHVYNISQCIINDTKMMQVKHVGVEGGKRTPSI